MGMGGWRGRRIHVEDCCEQLCLQLPAPPCLSSPSPAHAHSTFVYDGGLCLCFQVAEYLSRGEAHETGSHIDAVANDRLLVPHRVADDATVHHACGNANGRRCSIDLGRRRADGDEAKGDGALCVS